jgi:hypothetical protein
MPSEHLESLKNPDNGWPEWRKHVLLELERLDQAQVATQDHLATQIQLANQLQLATQIQLTTLRVKAGVWGLVGAAIPTGIALAISLL